MSRRGPGISQGNNGPRRSTGMKVAFNITSKSESKDMTKGSPNNMWAPENVDASLTTEKMATHSHMTTHDEMTLTQAHTDVPPRRNPQRPHGKAERGRRLRAPLHGQASDETSGWAGRWRDWKRKT